MRYGSDLVEQLLKTSCAFQEFKRAFPDLEKQIVDAVEKIGYREIMRWNLDDKTRRLIYSAYCWMRTQPWVPDYFLFT